MIDAETLGRLALFADLTRPQLEAVAHSMDEVSFPRDARVLREGLSGNAFYVITSGEAVLRIEGEERVRFQAGDFFGELSILTGEPVVADVVAASEELRCAVLPGSELRPLLREHAPVAVRMLEVVARRLRSTTLWAA